MDDLSDTQNIAEDRTTRTKTEYAVLQARYHMLEEQYREVRQFDSHCKVLLLNILFISLLVGAARRGTPGGGTETSSRNLGTRGTRSFAAERELPDEDQSHRDRGECPAR